MNTHKAKMSILLTVPFWGTLVAQPDGLFTGELRLAFVAAGQTNVYDFQLRLKHPVWELSLESSNSHCQVFCSSKQIVWADTYPLNSPTGELNTAMVKILKGSRPFDMRAEEHVWLALLSRGTFVGQKLPLADTQGLCMREPSVVTRIDRAENDISPNYMEWHNERGEHSNEPRFECQFRWLTRTNIGNNFNVPIDSVLTAAIKGTNGELKVVTLSELLVKNVSELDRQPRNAPDIQGRNVVYDYRLNDNFDRKPAYYQINDGQIPSKNSRVVLNAYHMQHIYRNHKGFPIFFWACVVVVTLGLLLLALRKNKTKQN